MSLVLLLGNARQVILVGDRRVSSRGTPVSEEYNKVGLLVPQSLPIRAGFGFAGIAAVGNLNVRRILLELLSRSLTDADVPSIDPIATLQDNLKSTFRNHRLLRTVSAADKRFTLVLAGYDYRDTPPRLSYYMLSNFQDFITHTDRTEARTDFYVHSGREKRPLSTPMSLIQRIGVWPAAPASDLEQIRPLLERDKPARAIIQKAVSIVRSAADRPSAAGLIGKQSSWIVVPRDPERAPEFGYESAVPSTRIPLMTAVLGPVLIDGGFATQSGKSDRSVMTYGIVPKNAPCPCGSGRKFKRCHGRKR